MAIPMLLQAMGASLLGRNLLDRYNDRNKSSLLGSLGTPDMSVPSVNMSGQNFDAQGNPQEQLIAGKQGTGLLGTLQGMDPAKAEQIAPLLQQMPYQDLRKYAAGIAAQPFAQSSPLSSIAKLQADLAAGRISQEQYNTAVSAMNKPAVAINQFPSPPQSMAYADPTNPMQGLVPIPGGEKDPNSPNFKWTEGEMLAGGYANRMLNAEDNMASMVSQGFDPASTFEHFRAGVPLIGNYTASSEFQQYRQAQEDWVRAKLRKESGAVIADEEMAREISTYFPQPGDGPEVIRQKEQARREATKGMAESSRGYLERRLRKTRPDPKEFLRRLGLE